MIDFETLVLPRSPNAWLCAPEGLCQAARPHRLAPVYRAGPQDLRAAMLAALAVEPRTALAEQDEAAGRFAFTARTALLRFVDDMDLRIVPQTDGRVSLALYSRSRVGYSDMGVNAKRGLRILDAIDARMQA